MASENAKELKERLQSIQSTQKMTNAMRLVSYARLPAAREQLEKSRPYFEILQRTLEQIVRNTRDFSSEYWKAKGDKQCLIVIGGDRGMAGAYNHRILNQAQKEMENADTCILPIGEKIASHYQKQSSHIFDDTYTNANEITIGNCFEISKMICKAFLASEIHHIKLIYTQFDSLLSQKTMVLPLLPLVQPTANHTDTHRKDSILYEPDAQTVYDLLVPEYIAGVLYGAVCESRTSELAARYYAMNTSNQNAQELLASMMLRYNQVRQSAITQELAEINADSEEI